MAAGRGNGPDVAGLRLALWSGTCVPPLRPPGRASVRSWLDLERSTDRGRAFLHSLNPDHRVTRTAPANSDSVVLDDQHQVGAAFFEQHVDRRCVSMLGDVVQGLLRDPIDTRFD